MSWGGKLVRCNGCNAVDKKIVTGFQYLSFCEDCKHKKPKNLQEFKDYAYRDRQMSYKEPQRKREK